jgi:hypothetical protein
MKRLTTIKILDIFPLVFLCALLTAGPIYAGEPSGDYQITGPKIIGQLILKNLRDDSGADLGMINVTFKGICKREFVKIKLCDFVTGLSSFDEITKEMLLGYVLYYEGPSDCKSECGMEDIMLTRVLSFQKLPDKIVANVVFEFVEYLAYSTSSAVKSKIKSKK